MGGLFSSPEPAPPPAPVQAAVAPSRTAEKVTARNADSTNQRRRASAAGSGRNTILTSNLEDAVGEAKTILGG